MIRRVIIPTLLSVALMIGSVASVWADSGSVTEQADAGGGNSRAEAERFDRMAELLYRAAKESNRQAGYLYIQQLRVWMEKQKPEFQAGQEGWEIVVRTADEVEKTIASGKPGADWLTGAVRIRLAADAMLRPETPLWHSYETVMRDDMVRIVKAWNRTDGQGTESARAAIDSLIAHYDRIEAAARLQLEPVRADELKERLAYAVDLLEAGTRDYAQPEWTGRALVELEASLSRLFEGTPAAEPLPAVAPVHAGNPISWVLMLGAIIMGVLAFSGYRKYKQQPYGIKPFR